MLLQPSASYSFIVRTETSNRPGMLGRVTTAIGEEGGDIGAIDIVRAGGGKMLRDITVAARDEAHAQSIVERVRTLDGVNVLHVTDRTFLVHLGGKIEVVGRIPVKGREDLSMVYTPGVARICQAIARDLSQQWTLTVKRHTVAVVTDGSAVLGLGNIGPAAAQPVMEGKCMIFKAFANLDAFPICLATQDPDEIVQAVQHLAPVFGGINLEDIAAPKCFEIEERLRGLLDIPVMHDDQHGTAVVVMAALQNALRSSIGCCGGCEATVNCWTSLPIPTCRRSRRWPKETGSRSEWLPRIVQLRSGQISQHPVYETRIQARKSWKPVS